MFTDMTFVLFFGFVAALIIGGLVYAWYANKKRREGLSALADEWMYRFAERDDVLKESLSQFYLLNRGRNKKLRNVLQGQNRGIEVAVFDYLHTTGGGKSSREHTESVIVLQSSRLSLPFFTVRPKGTFEFLRKRFGKAAITFADDPQFDEKYLVFPAKDADPNPVITTLKMNIREQLARESKLIVEGNRDRLVVYRERKRLNIDDLRSFLDEAISVFDHFAKSDGWN